MAICGLHWVPNRKSRIGTFWKKRKLSKAREAMMPRVVRTAMAEQTNRPPITAARMAAITPPHVKV